MSLLDDVLDALRREGREVVSTLAVPALPEPTERGARVRVEVATSSGVRVVTSLPEGGDRSRDAEAASAIVAATLVTVAARAASGADAGSENASNATYAALVAARPPLPARTVSAAVAATHRVDDFGVLSVAWSALHLDEVAEDDAPAALSLLRDLAEGVPPEWALRSLAGRVVGP